MRVVIVDSDVSYPATSGKRLRTLNLMLRLADRHELVYVGRCAKGSVEEQQAPTFLRGHGIEPVLVFDPIAPKSGPLFYARLAGNLVADLPYSVASHKSPALAEALTRVARAGAVDVWQFEWLACAAMLDPAIPGGRVLIAHNVETLLWERYQAAARTPLKRWYLGVQARKFSRCERRTFQEVDRVVAVSAEDAALVRTRFGQAKVDVVDNGIDRAFYERARGIRNPRRILFLGALDWRPNLDAIDLLLDKIFPQVRAQETEARLQIVGRHPSAGLVQRIRSAPGVELHADVPDVRPFLAEAGVMAVPLRIGGGSRLKILEALACGLPVVSTQVGAEGLELAPEKHYVRAEEEAFAAALVHALRDPAKMQVQAERGRQVVLELYDWSALALKLEQTWEACAAQAQERDMGRMKPCVSCS